LREGTPQWASLKSVDSSARCQVNDHAALQWIMFELFLNSSSSWSLLFFRRNKWTCRNLRLGSGACLSSFWTRALLELFCSSIEMLFAHRDTAVFKLWEGTPWCHQPRTLPLTVGCWAWRSRGLGNELVTLCSKSLRKYSSKKSRMEDSEWQPQPRQCYDHFAVKVFQKN